MCEPSKLTNLFTLLPKVRTHWRRRVFYFIKMGTKKLFTSEQNGNALLCYGNYEKDIVITVFGSDLENRISIILNINEVKDLIIEFETLIKKMENNG